MGVGFDCVLPSGLVFDCVVEAKALALEGRLEDCTVGKKLEIEQVREIKRIAGRHGFRLAGLRSFRHPLTLEQIRTDRWKAAQAAGCGPA